MTNSHLLQISIVILSIYAIGVSLGTQIRKSKWKTISPFLLMLTGLLLLSGCSGQAMPGSTVKFKRTLNFYLDNGRGGYIMIDKQNYPSILAGAEWVLDDGLSLVEENFSLSPAEVTWTRFDTKYTAQGASLTVEVEVQVSEDSEPGWLGIRLKLPGLNKFSAARGSNPVFPELNLLPGISEDISIAGVTVHETAGARNLAVMKNVGMLLIIGVVIIGAILLFIAIGNWSRS